MAHQLIPANLVSRASLRPSRLISSPMPGR